MTTSRPRTVTERLGGWSERRSAGHVIEPGGFSGWRLPRLPGWLREELVSFALFAVWLAYLGAGSIVLVMAVAGKFTDRVQAVLLIGFGLLAPMVGRVVQVHVERVAGPQPGLLWQLGRRRLGARPWPPQRRARVRDLALTVGSVALFWTAYTGSVLTALLVPVAVWTWILLRPPH